MNTAPFWYIDDDQRIRWAVRVSRALSTFEPSPGASIVFTSTERQLSTSYGLDKEQSELSRYELLELLSHAKLEVVVRSHAEADRRVAA